MKAYESFDDAEQFLLETARHIEAGGELTTEQQDAYLNVALLLMAESFMDRGMSAEDAIECALGMAFDENDNPKTVTISVKFDEDGLLELSIRGEKE